MLICVVIFANVIIIMAFDNKRECNRLVPSAITIPYIDYELQQDDIIEIFHWVFLVQSVQSFVLLFISVILQFLLYKRKIKTRYRDEIRKNTQVFKIKSEPKR